jgi:hypothetical protein
LALALAGRNSRQQLRISDAVGRKSGRGSKEIGKKRKQKLEQTTTTQKPQQPYTGKLFNTGSITASKL